MGKSEARANFLPLVQALAQGGEPVEITEHGKVAAVLISNLDYQLLLARAKMQPEPKGSLVGSMILNEDLAAADDQIARLFRASLGRKPGEA